MPFFQRYSQFFGMYLALGDKSILIQKDARDLAIMLNRRLLSAKGGLMMGTKKVGALLTVRPSLLPGYFQVRSGGRLSPFTH